LVEKLALRTDSGGAGLRRGGQGYEKHYRALVDCRTIVTADRVRLGCYGLNGGKAGQPFCVTVDADGDGYDLGGLVDGEAVLKGQIVRVVTTGGGGWGDPLRRELELVLRDVVEGRVSLASAQADYGVVFTAADAAGQPVIDEAATKQCRSEMAKTRNTSSPMIDRGDGYEKMLRGEHRPRMR
jgi:N-methylhydantoinase B